jgi:uncharacterized protein
MVAPSSPAAERGDARNFPSALKVNQNRRLSKACPAATTQRIPQSLRPRFPSQRTVVRGFLSGRKRLGSAYRPYHTTSRRQVRSPQSPQATGPRSCSRPARGTDCTVGYRHQSTPAAGQLSVAGSGAGNRKALSPLQSVCVTALRGYKILISPWLPSACRFHPTCSEYMRQAIEVHGVPRGFWLGIRRLGKCHPFHTGGVDPVPERKPPERDNSASRNSNETLRHTY